MTDQTPTATDEVADLNPERCTHTWTPAPDTPLAQVYPSSVRCTRRAHTGDDHHWDSTEQRRWTDETRQLLLEAMQPTPSLTPGTAYQVRVNGGEAKTLRTLDADA